MSPDQTRPDAILDALLEATRDDGLLPWGTFTQIAREFGVSSERVRQIASRNLLRVDRKPSAERNWHGTPNGYDYHNCRCDECREAKRVHRRKYPW